MKKLNKPQKYSEDNVEFYSNEVTPVTPRRHPITIITLTMAEPVWDLAGVAEALITIMEAQALETFSKMFLISC